MRKIILIAFFNPLFLTTCIIEFSGIHGNSSPNGYSLIKRKYIPLNMQKTREPRVIP